MISGREDEIDLGHELQRRVLAYGLEYCLTAAQREAVDLCCMRGLSGTQAAKLAGVHPSTMSRRLTRALTTLRGLAAGPGPGAGPYPAAAKGRRLDAVR